MAPVALIPSVESKRAEIEALCARFGVRRLELFGSAVKGTFDPARSDLDFLVEFEDRGPGGRLFKRYLGLAEGLEALFGRPADLVSLDAIENRYLREDVEANRVTLYAA